MQTLDLLQLQRRPQHHGYDINKVGILNLQNPVVSVLFCVRVEKKSATASVQESVKRLLTRAKA